MKCWKETASTYSCSPEKPTKKITKKQASHKKQAMIKNFKWGITQLHKSSADADYNMSSTSDPWKTQHHRGVNGGDQRWTEQPGLWRDHIRTARIHMYSSSSSMSLVLKTHSPTGKCQRFLGKKIKNLKKGLTKILIDFNRHYTDYFYRLYSNKRKLNENTLTHLEQQTMSKVRK